MVQWLESLHGSPRLPSASARRLRYAWMILCEPDGT